MDVNRYCLNDVIVLHARGTRGVPGGGEHEIYTVISTHGACFGAPRGRRVGLTVNRLSTTTDNVVPSGHIVNKFKRTRCPASLEQQLDFIKHSARG